MITESNPHKPAEESSAVYKCTCKAQCCKETDVFHLGLRTVTNKKRFKQHNATKKHFGQILEQNITQSEIIRNVSVMARCRMKEDLSIIEGLSIKRLNPTNKLQDNVFGRTLSCSGEFIFCLIRIILFFF